MKIGIFGGTFNPPHLGHMAAAAAAIDILKLDKLILIPDHTPPHQGVAGKSGVQRAPDGDGTG